MAQPIAYDDAGNYLVSANWTNGANAGFGFMPWVFTTNGPDSQGTYALSLNNPQFVIASSTNVTGTNYTDVWGLFANGPTDVNQTAFNRAINYPAAAWTPTALTCLKTEAFGFTFGRNLDQVWATLDFGSALGFAMAQRSHLVGAGDSTAAWLKEVRAAEGKRFESVVLFAIDQFCLIGYDVPLPGGLRRSFRTCG